MLRPPRAAELGVRLGGSSAKAACCALGCGLRADRVRGGGGPPDLDGLVALGPIAAEPALQALDQFAKVGKIKVCVFDISPVIVQALIKNQVEFAIDQQEWLQGYLPVVFLANYVKYGSILQNDLILTGPNFVTSENAQKVVNLLSLGFH